MMDRQPGDCVFAIDSRCTVYSLRGTTNVNRKLVREIFWMPSICPLDVQWIPSHVILTEKEEADRLASAALSITVPTVNVPHS